VLTVSWRFHAARRRAWRRISTKSECAMPSDSRPSRIVAKTECRPPATAARAVAPVSSARPLMVPTCPPRRSFTLPDNRQEWATPERNGRPLLRQKAKTTPEAARPIAVSAR